MVFLDAPTVTAELIILRWMLPLLSNTELASISNLNQTWRKATNQAVLEEAIAPSINAPLLLLPSMVRNILHYCPRTFANGESSRDCAFVSLRPSEETKETFCVAWFAPDGIKAIELCMANDSTTSVCVEWTGYSTAMQVLQPFSYDADFVHDLLSRAFSLSRHRNWDENSWIAVRGATFARPESFCLCFEALREKLKQDVSLSITQAESHTVLENTRLLDRLQRDVCPQVIQREALRTKAVQFLNATQSRATCMMTPRFHAPIGSPMTIICVGVATEDGCFISGLFHRLELGHLYPQSSIHATTELSSICLATDSGMVKTEWGSESASDVCYMDSNKPLIQRCTCQYQGVCDKAATADDENDDSSHEPPFVYRGVTGPGTWHCYVAILDGENTVIRVDGRPESSSTKLFGETESGIEPTILLDGLTLGSDHCFGMPLCCGGMSDGTGHGAIAEVAVFSGLLPHNDIVILEQCLMKKHMIVAAEEVNKDEWEREAHAIMLFEDETVYRRNVPLKYLARHRNVAWSQCDPVTGQSLVIKRIGSRRGAESSDF